jgi:hypothetical protein
VFYVVGSSGIAATSPDAITWTYLGSITGVSGPLEVSINGSIMCVAGGSGQASISTNGGTSWTVETGLAATAWGTTSLRGMQPCGTGFMLLGTGNQIAFYTP